jgi:O-antigen/teichoic acid export membrane protein
VAESSRLADAPCDVVPEPRRQRGFLVRSALALVSTSFLTSGLGFIYWAASARLFPPSDLGAASAAIAAMNLIAPLTNLGFGSLLLAELPGMRAGRSELVATATVVGGIFGGAVALICAMVLPPNFLGLPGVGSDGSATLLFAAGVAAQGVGMMLDSALLSVAGGGPQFRRNATLSVVKLLLVVVFALTLSQQGSLSIYASWFLANVVSIMTMTIWLARKHRVAVRRMWPTRSALRGLRYVAAQHHALNLALQVPYFAMPIVANVTLGSEQAGYLYATWSVAGFVFILPIALTTALFASGARDTSTFVRELRFTLRYSLAACVAANLVILPLGGVVLRVFGTKYAHNGHTTLILLCLAGFGMIVKDHHVTIARVNGRVGREAMLVWGLTVCELVAASVGASLYGLTGLSQGWVLAVLLEVVVFAPLVLRAYRGRIEPPFRRFWPVQRSATRIRQRVNVDNLHYAPNLQKES